MAGARPFTGGILAEGQTVEVGNPASRLTPASPGSAYFVIYKQGTGDDASMVLCLADGTIIGELGAAADLDMHLKVVNPDGLGGNTFTDGLIIKRAAPNTGYVYVPLKLGIGTVPVELLHVAGAGGAAARITGKIENTNATSGQSNGAQFNFVGRGTNFALGTDVGLNGGNNAFLVNAAGAYMTGILVDASGHLGVLTDSPGSALDVNGAITVRGDVSGLSPIRMRGRSAVYGPPTANAYVAGDVVTDAGGTTWLCTVSGTPGTWASTGTTYNVLSYGALRNLKSSVTGTMGASSANLTDTTAAPFAAADVGKLITVVGAGAAGVDLSTTIATYNSPSSVTLTAGATTAVSGATYRFASDDSTAINAAITAAAVNGGTVFMPAGNYGLGATVTMANNVRIESAGAGIATLWPFGATCAITKIATSGSPLTNAALSRLAIDGAAQVGPYTTGIKGVYVQYAANCTFTDLLIRNCVATGLGIDFLTQGTVVDWVRAINNGRLNQGGGSGGGGNGIGIGTGQHSVEDFTVSNSYASGNGRYGIMIESQTGTTSRGMRFVGCYSVSNLNSGFGDAGGSGAQFIGCVSAQNNQDGFTVDNGTIGATAQPGGNTMFIGCEAIANTRYGFTYNPTATNTTSAAGAGNIKWSGCKAWNNTSLGWYINPLSGHAVSGIYIGDCDATGNGASGIQVSNSVNGLTITNCKIRSNGQSSVSSLDGVFFNGGTVTNLFMHGNRIWDDGGTQKQAYAIHIASGVTISTATIASNDFRGNLTGALSNAGTLTNCVIEKNPGGPVSVTYAATQNTDCSLGDVFEVTLTGNVTLANPTNMVDGQKITWRFTQDATGGRVLTLGSAFDVPFVLQAGPSGVDHVQAIYNAALSTWNILNPNPPTLNMIAAQAIGAVAATMDPTNGAGTPGITTGRPYFCLVNIAAGQTIDWLDVDIISASGGSLCTAAYLGIYDAAGGVAGGGALLGVTSEFSTAVNAATAGALTKVQLNPTTPIGPYPVGKQVLLCLLMVTTGTITVVGGRQYGSNQSAVSGKGRLYTNSSGSTMTTLPSTVPALIQTSGFVLPYVGAYH